MDFYHMILIYTWIAVAITALLLYLHQVYTRLSRYGVNHRPITPFFGNIFWVLFKKEHLLDCIMKTIKAFPDDKMVGHYELVSPVVIIRDKETIKRITIKDFEYFVDRRRITGKSDPMFGRGLLMLTGEEWKAMRATMSPAFTSSKIRLMVPFMMEVGEVMIKVLKKKIEDSGNPYIDVEARDMVIRYANDVIASCAFGLKVDSQSRDNHFFTMCKAVTTFPLSRILKVLFYRCLPEFAQMIGVKLMPSKISKFFKEMVLGTMKNREDNNIVRNDLINILMQVKKEQLIREKDAANTTGFTTVEESFVDKKQHTIGQLTREIDAADTDAGFATVQESFVGKKQHNIEWTEMDLVAQAVLFLFAGFETVSTAMSFLLHEMAVNPDVQARLVQEIKEHDAKNAGKFDFDSIQNMPYLDMVVSELLRLWPAAPLMDRRCVKDYNVGRPNSTATEDLIIRKGEVVVFPTWAFHRDPELYPDPQKFDPERFSPENREKIKPFTYLPFGMGPRNCIASRFALCEMKVLLYQVLREMELYPCEKTCIPTELSEEGFIMRIKGGAWVRLRARSAK